jgi:heptaprenylglyceryl phosphate synthase
MALVIRAAILRATVANRTIPVSGDKPYINIYVLDSLGTWKYIPEKNMLELITSGDARAKVSAATIPNAAFMVLFTVDTTLTPSFLKAYPNTFIEMAHATAGFSALNMELTASALKMASIVQYTLSPPAAATAANLPKTEVSLFIMQVGYTE